MQSLTHQSLWSPQAGYNKIELSHQDSLRGATRVVMRDKDYSAESVDVLDIEPEQVSLVLP
jgi:hypothetical protein